MSDVDGPAQQAMFVIEGPDEDGCVWMCSPEGRDVWCQNLGPYEKAAKVMADWLSATDMVSSSRP